jgi:hypothetical protein
MVGSGIIGVEPLGSVNKELATGTLKLITPLHRCDSMCCRGFTRSVTEIQILEPR